MSLTIWAYIVIVSIYITPLIQIYLNKKSNKWIIFWYILLHILATVFTIQFDKEEKKYKASSSISRSIFCYIIIPVLTAYVLYKRSKRYIYNPKSNISKSVENNINDNNIILLGYIIIQCILFIEHMLAVTHFTPTALYSIFSIIYILLIVPILKLLIILKGMKNIL